jgi:hypothetical protein
MIARFVPAALLIAPLAFVACTIEKAPNTPPPASEPAATAAPTPVAVPVVKTCPPVGYWKASGPAGDTEIKVSESFGKPGSYDVSYKGVNLAQGAGTADGNNFTVDTGQASGGMFNCKLAEDCKTMNCGFTGQQPTVFTKSGG